ncbi:MAG: DUF2141 domain-containing protein [Rhodospirillales bacterium]
MIRAVLTAAFVCAVFSAHAAAADLTVRITGLNPIEGNVHAALYDKPETFPKPKGMVGDIITPVTDRAVEVTFKNIPPGDYALAVFHDENLNGEFDQGLFDFPLEGFAFSNGAKPGLSAPDFEDAAVTVGAEHTVTDIEMDYWIGGAAATPEID